MQNEVLRLKTAEVSINDYAPYYIIGYVRHYFVGSYLSLKITN